MGVETLLKSTERAAVPNGILLRVIPPEIQYAYRFWVVHRIVTYGKGWMYFHAPMGEVLGYGSVTWPPGLRARPLFRCLGCPHVP